MFIVHLALGGCLRPPPISFGITSDTGGHIAYVIDAAMAQGKLTCVSQVHVVTRLFNEPNLGLDHNKNTQKIADKVYIIRIPTASHQYLEKEALEAEIPSFIAAFSQYLSELPRKPDVIHAHFSDAAMIALCVKQTWGLPVVYTPHALGIDKLKQQCGSDLGPRIEAERSAIKRADGIIVSTKDEAQRQIQAYGVDTTNRLHCLSPGIPTHLGKAEHRAKPYPLHQWLSKSDKPIILAIARPVRKKNLAALLRSYAANPDLQRMANLVILAGQHSSSLSGEEHEVIAELHQLSAMHNLGGLVALPPHHNATDIAALYSKAAAGGVFVNPALHEPFGLTVLEAAEAGVPVVATREGGPSEILAKIGHGMLIDPRDDAAIAYACQKIISDPQLHQKYAEAARSNAGLFNWNRYASSSIEFYSMLAARPKLFASDIDNTLTGCAAGAAAFRSWRRKMRVPFVVATGRRFDDARATLQNWELPEPDAYITDVGTRIMLRQPNRSWGECPSYAEILNQDWKRNAVSKVLDGLALTPQPSNTAGPHKLSFFGNRDDAKRVTLALRANGLEARVIFSHGKLIDVLAPKGGKAAAIAAYASMRGIRLSDCVAAGDSGNDFDMLSACGHGIVVGNASPELDDLVPRPGLRRSVAHHAAGVMEGLAALGIA